MARPDLNVLPPASVSEALAQIAHLDADKFNLLREQVEGVDGFDADRERCERLGPQLGLTPDALGYLLSATSYLYARVNRKYIEPKSVASIIDNFVDGFSDKLIDGASKKDFADRLTILVARKDPVERLRKRNRLRSGFLPNAKSFNSLVDIRPNYNKEHDEIDEYLLVTQLLIQTDSSDPDKNELVIQLDEKGLRDLKKIIEDIEKKIQTAKSSPISSKLIFQAVKDD